MPWLPLVVAGYMRVDDGRDTDNGTFGVCDLAALAHLEWHQVAIVIPLHKHVDSIISAVDGTGGVLGLFKRWLRVKY